MGEDRIQKSGKVAIFVRWVILITVIGMTLVGNHLSTTVPSHAILAGMALYVTVSALWGRKWDGRGRLSMVVTTLDVLMITVLVWITGGARSQYYVLYYFPVMYAGMRLSFRDGIGAAVLSAALYVFVALAEVRTVTPSVIIAGRAGTFCCSSVVLITFYAVAARQLRFQRHANEQLHTAVERLSAVYDVGRAAHGGSVREILDTLVCQVMRIASACCATAGVLKTGSIRVVATAHTDTLKSPPSLDVSLAMQAVAGRAPTAPVITTDTLECETMCIPLKVQGEAIAVLQLWSEPNRRFGQNDKDAATAVCAEAAAALDNVMLRDELAHTAATDYLTQLCNRREFERLLAAEVHRCQARDTQCAVVMLDVDGFKQCNDVAGHAAGDQVLLAMAAAIREVMGPGDIAARYGGDEFGIALSGAGTARAREITETLQRDFTARTKQLECLPWPVTASGGITLWKPGQHVSDLIRRADRIMYSAKRRGRDCLITDEDVSAEDESGKREEDATTSEHAYAAGQ